MVVVYSDKVATGVKWACFNCKSEVDIVVMLKVPPIHESLDDILVCIEYQCARCGVEDSMYPDAY